MNMWQQQITGLQRYVEIMAAGGYKEEEKADIKDDIKRIIEESGMDGINLSEISETLCMSRATVKYHLTVMTAKAIVSMLPTSPRRFVSNSLHVHALTRIKSQSADKKANGRRLGLEAMRVMHEDNVKKTVDAIRYARTISTAQLMEITGLKHTAQSRILNDLKQANKIKARTGAYGAFWWSMK